MANSYFINNIKNIVILKLRLCKDIQLMTTFYMLDIINAIIYFNTLYQTVYTDMGVYSKYELFSYNQNLRAHDRSLADSITKFYLMF